jgi:drug/metabolite transporter (DMT)-like permease
VFVEIPLRKMELQSFIKDAIPFVAMVLVECGEVVMITLGKAAMNTGLSNLVYVVYYNTLGTLLLFPYFIFHTTRTSRPPLTFSILSKFFLLGLIGICLLQVCAYAGINYSSPTLAAAMGNLIPGFTFVFAIIFRMEKLELKRSSSQAKSIGTIVAITGAFVMTLYRGPVILKITSDSISPNQNLLLSQESNWVIGGLFLSVTCICSSAWNIFQTATVKEYQDLSTVVFFFCLFGTIQCAILSLVVERNLNAWTLHTRIEIIAIAFAAIFGSLFRISTTTWCLRKKGPLFVAMFKPLSMVIAVIMGMLFLGDTLVLGSVIGAVIITLGFYTVMWGQSQEKKRKKNMADDDIVNALESSSAPLLQK